MICARSHPCDGLPFREIKTFKKSLWIRGGTEALCKTWSVWFDCGKFPNWSLKSKTPGQNFNLINDIKTPLTFPIFRAPQRKCYQTSLIFVNNLVNYPNTFSKLFPNIPEEELNSCTNQTEEDNTFNHSNAVNLRWYHLLKDEKAAFGSFLMYFSYWGKSLDRGYI